MDGPQVPSTAAIGFASAAEAERRIAGVAAAARIVHKLAEAGLSRVWLAVANGEAIGPRAMEDIDRLAGSMAVLQGDPGPDSGIGRLPGDRLVPAEAVAGFLAGDPVARAKALRLDHGATMELLRRTGKLSDGPVSRWLNRPVSRRLSTVLLQLPRIRPAHATAGTALLAVAMFAALVVGDAWGLVAGALLFQAASVFDGVDGEIARATFRCSPAGAALDTTIDMATNILFVLGLSINLTLRGDTQAVVLAGWGLSLFLLGLGLQAVYAIRRRAPFSLDRVKQHYRHRASGPAGGALMVFLTRVSSRDFFALLFALLVLVGLPVWPLVIFAAAATVWIVFVVASLFPDRAATLGADEPLPATTFVDARRETG